MTSTKDPFATPPQPTFPILAGGVPAIIGPWVFRIHTNRPMMTLPVHQLTVQVEAYPAGSFRMDGTWTYTDDAGNRRIHGFSHVLPRPEDGTHLGKVLFHQTHHDPYASGISWRGKPRKGVTYSLTVTHLYRPHADHTIADASEQHRRIAQEIAPKLDTVAKAVGAIRAALSKPPV